VSYLLLPADERVLVARLCDDLGWELVSGRMEGDRPERIAAWESILSPDLPSAGDLGRGPIWVLMFWSPEWGPAVSIRDAPRPRDVVRRAIRQTAAESGRLEDVIDPHSSPAVMYRRCFWNADAEIGLGFLKGMDRPRKDWPASLRTAFGTAERLLKRDAVKINPFDYMDGARRIDRVATWVRPAAWEWLQSGGRISSATGF
jgi:hypothetical protein